VTATFVSPAHVDAARLDEAMGWFTRAHGGTPGPGAVPLDEASWRTVAFTRKPDLRSVPRAYPETGPLLCSLHSSGTTAEPVFSPWSEVDQHVADTTAREIHARCPSIQGARCAVIAPGPPLAVAHFMLREIELSGGVPWLVEPGEPERVWRTLIDQGIEVVFTLPLVASRLIEYFHATRRGSPAGVSVVFCAGDVLSPARQSTLAAMWEARVLNMYGCSELFGPLAGPGEGGHPLVWSCDPVGVEVINPASMSPCGVGERGVLVVTTLWPKARPLQRYWTDDTIEVTHTVGVDGVFGFHFIGRPSSVLKTHSGQVAMRDIDDLLLGSGVCGLEWSVRQTPEGWCVRSEMPTRTAGAVSQLTEALTETLGGPVEFVPQEPWSLPRATPKFGVATTAM
jgi:phenylacetate-coenzyme A ligase PaaK-like adenylate-forming protein